MNLDEYEDEVIDTLLDTAIGMMDRGLTPESVFGALYIGYGEEVSALVQSALARKRGRLQ